MDLISLAITLIIVLIVIILVLICVYYINRIVVLSNRIDNAWAQIDVQLKKRADLVPNLVETVKGYAAHERKAFENVTKARERMVSAGGVEEKMKAGNELSAALKTLFAIAENYPNLKASENFKLLQEQLDGIESKIAYARQFYNDSTLSFNNIITTIPGRWFAGSRVKRPYFEVTEEERAPVKVSF
jgi:LemA protein